MKIESTAFTAQHMHDFLDELLLAERDSLVARLEAAGERLRHLAGRVPEGASEGDGWTAHEVLAHIAVLSKFYGVLVYRIGSGALTELDLLGNVNLRDVAGEQLARVAPAELVEMALADQRRTAGYLRGAGADALQRQATLSSGGTMSASEIARLPLVAHLESHLAQLEALVDPA